MNIGDSEGTGPVETFKDPEESRPWWLLNFYFELPFYYPYLDGATFNVTMPQERWAEPRTADLPETPFVLLLAIQPSMVPPLEPSGAMQLTLQTLLRERGEGGVANVFDYVPTSGPIHFVSIVEAITPKVMLQSEIDIGLPHHPSTYVNRCLQALNLWVRTIAVVTMDPSIRTMQPENLPMFVPFFHQRPGDGRIIKFDLFQAHENPATSTTVATPYLATRVGRYASSIDDAHGLFRAREWCHTAVRLSTVEGRYDLAIVALNTAFEVLVFGLARMLLIDEGMLSAELDTEFAGRMGVGTLYHRYFEHRIGGRWVETDTSCALGQVFVDIVSVRNRVAHQGLSVQAKQVGSALASFAHFTDFLVMQVAAKKHRFPRTFMDLINAFGRPSGMAIGSKFDSTAESIVKASPNYWLPKDDPRQTKLPPAIVETFPGNLPATARPEKAQQWATTTEPFMHLVTRAAGEPTDAL